MSSKEPDHNEQSGGRGADGDPVSTFLWVMLVVVAGTVPIALFAVYLQKTIGLAGSPQLAFPGIMALVLTAGHTAPKTVKTFGLVVIVGTAAGSLGALIYTLVLGISDGLWFHVLGMGLAICVTMPTIFLAYRWLGVLSWNIPPGDRS